MMTNKLLSYSEMIRFPDFFMRLEYLKLSGKIAEPTFGAQRYLNQRFYRSAEWRRIRNLIIARDDGCDLGIIERPIQNYIHIHHLNQIDTSDILQQTEILLNPEYLVCVSLQTHNYIHYGNPKGLIISKERVQGDTKLW